MSVLLPVESLRLELSVDGKDATFDALLARVSEDMYENKSLAAVTRWSRRACLVVGCGVMRDGSRYIMVKDATRRGDEALVTLTLVEFVARFRGVESCASEA